jgi:transketolase
MSHPSRATRDHAGENVVDDAKAGIEKKVVDTIRCLAMDAVQKANSGHPGTPMAMAPVAYTIWSKFLCFDPTKPTWPNRDRFVLSMGHASTLIYSTLHLAGVQSVASDYTIGDRLSVEMEDLKTFRQLHSRCAGHPEYHWTSGVETTTGPLGNGLATSVGMAISSKWLGATYNKPGYDLYNFNVYALAGDGCFQEGVSAEAASLAGHLKLDNLVWLWDNNHISIEGNTAWSFTEDVATRFVAYGWNITRVTDANDLEKLEVALSVAKSENNRPTLVVVDSHIAWGAPTKQDTHGAHGAPLGDKEIEGCKKFYGMPEKETFHVPDGVYDHFRGEMAANGGNARNEWEAMFAKYSTEYPDLAKQIDMMNNREMPKDWEGSLTEYPACPKGHATRASNGKIMQQVAAACPYFLGGSADLAPSTKTNLVDASYGDFMPPSSGWGDYSGRNFHFGIREHAMGAIMNGMCLSKLRSYGSGFFVFSDYMKPVIRLSAIMEIPTCWIFTHDSIGVGEDGPTHQPIEHLAMVRSIPGLVVFRPGDANENVEAWKWIMNEEHTPSVLVLSRQACPTLDRTEYGSATGTQKGGYILKCACSEGNPDVILIATGTEVQLITAAYDLIVAKGLKPRLVSMPSFNLFEKQSQEYRDSVIPPHIRARVGVEFAGDYGWGKYIGLDGVFIGMTGFGESAPLAALMENFNFTPQRIADEAVECANKLK